MMNDTEILQKIADQLPQLEALYQRGEKVPNGLNDALGQQFAVMQEAGNLTEPPYKYFANCAEHPLAPELKSDDEFTVNQWFIPHNEFRSTRDYFVKLKKDLGKTNYRDYGILTPQALRDAKGDLSQIDFSKVSAVFIPSGGIESVLLYEHVLEKKLKGELADLPILLENAKTNTPLDYFSNLHSSLGLTPNDKGALTNLGIYTSSKPSKLANKTVQLIAQKKIQPSPWINYKQDLYKTLPEGKQPVFIIHTSNKDKVNDIRRSMKYFGVSGYAYQSDETGMHQTHSSEEKENVFPTILHGKALEAQESFEESLKDGSYEKFKKGKFADEQVFHVVHDGGLRLDSRVYEHELFKPIADKLKAAGFSVDACNTKQIGEHAGGYKNLFELIYKIALDLGKDGKPNPDVLRVWEVDSISLFPANQPDKVCTYVSTQLNHVAVDILKNPELSSVKPNENKSSYYMISDGEKRTQAEMGKREGKVGFNLEEDRFLSTNTGFGHIIWTMINHLNFTFNRELNIEHEGGALNVTFYGNAPDQQQMLDKELLKKIKNEHFINLHEENLKRRVVTTPEALPDIQEEILRHTDIPVFLPRKKTDPSQKLTDKEKLRELGYLARDGLMTTAWYVDGQDLQTPFATGKPVICYFPKELHETHSFDYLEKPMQANARNFGGKGNPDNFRFYADSIEQVVELAYEHNLTHHRKELPEKQEHPIPKMGKTARPMVAVYGSSSTEDPDIWKESIELKKALLMQGLGVVYGGMVRGVGKAFAAKYEDDRVTGLLNDEPFLEKLTQRYQQMGWETPTIRSIYTPESKIKEGALLKKDYPHLEGIIDIEEVETPNIYVRMQAMKDGANENRINGNYPSVSIIEPGSNGSLEEFYDKLIELVENPSDHKIVLWNKQKLIPGQDHTEGYHEELIKLICDRCNIQDASELEKFGIYVRDDHREIINLAQKFSAEAAEMYGIDPKDRETGREFGT